MKVSDYIAQRLRTAGVSTVFGYQGSSIAHMIDSVCRSGLNFVEARHEQGAAFSANAYASASGELGVAIACSGPGAINLLGGVANAYYDSIPCLFITGQVSVKEIKKNPEMRQYGFQETDIVSMTKAITKYTVSLREPEQIVYELDKAIWLCREGRPGAVVLDIPHNVQNAQVDPKKAARFVPEVDSVKEVRIPENILEDFQQSKRPLILLGGGSQQLREQPEILSEMMGLGIPIVSSYRGKDVVDNTSELFVGTIGAYGNRSANLAMCYCDYLICLGSRMDGRQFPDGVAQTLKEASGVIVDIDSTEHGDVPEGFYRLSMEVSEFVSAFAREAKGRTDHVKWRQTLQRWCTRYPDQAEYRLETGVNPNRLMHLLSRYAAEDAAFTVDVGQNQLWANASLRIHHQQRLIQSCGLGAMGYALPGAIGAYCANQTQTICICGDGGFQMNLQELQVIAQYHIPVIIVILNNQSLGLIRVYQEKALGNRYFGSVEGFGSPDYKMLAASYGIPYTLIGSDSCDETIKEILDKKQAHIIEVHISSDSTCYPEPTYGSTIDNQSLELSAEEKKQIKEEATGNV